MKSNTELQQDVQNAIRWEPSMHAAEIGVSAKDGVVTLSGSVDHYYKKVNAERAAKEVLGVKAIAEEITVNYGSDFKKTDSEIATNIMSTWKTNWLVPSDGIKVKVEDGWVKLDGEVHYKFQEEAAKKSIEHLPGVRGVTNMVKIESKSKDVLERVAVQDALRRNWSINSKDIKVEVDQNKVKLTGKVNSLYQKDEATRLAWNAPGVWSVENDLAVIY